MCDGDDGSGKAGKLEELQVLLLHDACLAPLERGVLGWILLVGEWSRSAGMSCLAACGLAWMQMVCLREM